MLDINYIRGQLGTINTSGVFSEAAVRNITMEAERYARECVDKGLAGTLYDKPASVSDEGIALVKADLHAALKVISDRKIKG